MNVTATSRLICADTVPAFLMPKHVQRETTRHGKTVYYFRKDGRRSRIRSDAGTDAFYAEVKAFTGSRPERQPDLKPEHVTGWVYFARAGNRVKIGYSKNPRDRATGLRIGSSVRLRIYYVTPGTMALERQLHALFASDRVNGEWFLYTRAIKDWIASDESRRMTERGV